MATYLPSMKHLFTHPLAPLHPGKPVVLYLLLLLITVTAGRLAAQGIPYDITVLDNNEAPVPSRFLRQLVADERGGLYLSEEVPNVPAAAEVYYYSGDTSRLLYAAVGTVELAATDADGAYLFVRSETGYAEQQLVYVHRDGVADTLSQQPLAFPVGYLLGSTFVAIAHNGVFSYTNGTETRLDVADGRCDYSPADCYQRTNGGLLLYRDRQLYFTDGTAQGTRLLREDARQALAAGTTVFTIDNGLLIAHELRTGAATKLADQLPNLAGPLSVLNLLTTSGPRLLFLAQDGTNAYGIYVSDGTRAGTRLLEALPTDTYGGPATTYTTLPGTLVYEKNRSETTAEYWLTDGTPAGTRLAFTVPAAFRGVSLYATAGEGVYALVRPRESDDGESLVYYLTTTGPATLIGRHPSAPSTSQPTPVVNGRLLLGGAYYIQTLYSYGPTAGDVRTVGTLDLDARLLFTTSTTAYYESQATIYATQGGQDDLTGVFAPSSDTFGGQDDFYRMTESGGQTYLYAYDAAVGEALFTVQGRQTARLLYDLYPNTRGQGLRRLYGDATVVVWTGFDYPDFPPALNLNDGTTEGTVRIPAELSGADDFMPLGRIGEHLYYRLPFDNATLRVLDLTDYTVENLDAGVANSAGPPLLIGDTVYFIRLTQTTIFQQSRELVAYAPQAGTSTVLSTDNFTDRSYFDGALLAYDGRAIYFLGEQAQAGGAGGVSSYDPSSGQLRDLGALPSTAEITLRSISGKYATVAYQDEQFTPQLRLLLPDQFGTFVSRPVAPDRAVRLPSGFLALDQAGQPVAVAVDGEVTLLLDEPSTPVFTLQAVAISTATTVFLLPTADDERTLVYATDGTAAGTQVVADVEGRAFGSPALLAYGRLLVLYTDRGLYLIDPVNETQERVGLQLANETVPPLVVAFDRVYFGAVDPVYGEELHYLSITRDQDGDGVPYHRDCDDTDASVVPSPSDSVEGLPRGCAPGAVATSQVSTDASISVFPNPATSWLRVSVPAAGRGPAGYRAEVFDAAGRRLTTQLVDAQQVITLPEGAPGMLWLRLTDTTTGTLRVLKVVRH